MYFVDMRQMNELLDFFDETIANVKDRSFETEVEKYALERITHLLIESLIDVGNMMIDGFIMRDPGSYQDIIDILVDEQVIPESDKSAYQLLIEQRRVVVQEYKQINHDQLEQLLQEYYQPLSQFSKNIRLYLANEMGVANTFINKV
ncbi:HepT-like ribonuclease domain-containing protein [Gracilibacillus alcaliphilus]|uniref:HepT-like ribonuclease domain-containing protein n=1 Tax=Gracilibacillus alcaliphilus TaxID=1401441 RepID=UPI00195CD3AF|nr:uncharacterized protein YutE (UPF0331/DUF86 family) [Gracilibacillus alcaliphilus]